MVQRIVLATHNAKKAHELNRILAQSELPVQVFTFNEYPDAPQPIETESTFEGNALLKARAACEHTGLISIADDSGLCVNALNGMPGIFSARWSGASTDTDQQNLELVLAQVADVPEVRRGAQFVCVMAAVFPSGREFTVRGVMEGHLTDHPMGQNGFGYDPIFIPEGFDVTSAQLSPAQKDAISHRGHALRAMVQVLAQEIG